MSTIFVGADDRSLRGHAARAHIDLSGREVTIGVTHTTFFDEGNEPSEEGWNVHLSPETALAWAKAIVAAIEASR